MLIASLAQRPEPIDDGPAFLRHALAGWGVRLSDGSVIDAHSVSGFWTWLTVEQARERFAGSPWLNVASECPLVGPTLGYLLIEHLFGTAEDWGEVLSALIAEGRGVVASTVTGEFHAAVTRRRLPLESVLGKYVLDNGSAWLERDWGPYQEAVSAEFDRALAEAGRPGSRPMGWVPGADNPWQWQRSGVQSDVDPEVWDRFRHIEADLWLYDFDAESLVVVPEPAVVPEPVVVPEPAVVPERVAEHSPPPAVEVSLSEALRLVATPDLYRRNTFRLTGRAVDVPPVLDMELRRQRLEREWDVSPLSPPRVEPPRLGSFPHAVGRLQGRALDPVTRVVEEFFWFWRSEPGEDAGMSAWAAGDVERAEAVWEAAGTDVARHNLAVLNHLLALADDHAEKTSMSRWRRAHEHWLAVWRSEAFWQLLGDRVRRLGDTRLGPYTAPKFRAELPRILATISAAVAVRWAERDASDDVVLAHWQLAGLDGFPAEERADARQAATDSIVARIMSAFEDPELPGREQQTNVMNLYTAATDSARKLHTVTAAPLRTLTLAGVRGLDALYDAVAERLLRYAAGLVGRWDEGLTILRAAAETARGDDVSVRITELTDKLTALKKRDDEGTGRFGVSRR